MPGRSQYHLGQELFPAHYSRTELPNAESSFDPLKAGHDFLRRGTLLGVILSHVSDQRFHEPKSIVFLI